MSVTHNHRTPVYRLVVDGRDITPTVNARLVSLRLQESRGDEADQLDLTLSDYDGALAIPPKGVEISLALGWEVSALVEKGTYVVDEAEHSGAPDQITLRARSADMGKNLRARRDQSWHGLSLGAILTSIAKRHGLVPRLDTALAARAVAHVDQTNESDLNFLSRLGARYDAIATVKKGHLLFLPINGTRTSAGLALPVQTLTRADGDSHRYSQADRDAYTGVRAYWHSAQQADRKSVLVGKAGSVKVIKNTYASETDALSSARAEWQRVQRGAASLSLTLAQGNAMLVPQSPVAVRGFKSQIDSTTWLASKVSHSVDESGWVTQVELETTGSFE